MRTFVVILVLVLVTACGRPGGEPTLQFTEETPEDLRALADETFTDVLEAFPSRHGCLRDMVVAAARELDDRARYDPEHLEIAVRVPATAPQLRLSLVHEFAHHLEFACPAHTDVRARFLAAQGLPADAVWFTGPTWETTPSEQWASAVVEHVLDRRDDQARITVAPAALEVVREWS